MKVLEVKDIRKSLGRREIIKGISFSVKEGEIFGFLGPNGAGKTTTIRMMVGLIKPDQGSIKICGEDVVKNSEKALGNIGAIVENPEMYTYLTGRQNLNIVADLRGVDRKAIDEIVELVNLTGRIDDKVKKYSLGMKQRLGLAVCLLSKPKLLILDEPTNGLDPTGILDFREIVKKAARTTNTAVFVSSHILSEVQQLCDVVAFINDGQIQSVESITGGELKNETDTLVIVTKDPDKSQDIMVNMNSVRDIKREEDIFTVTAEKETACDIVRELVTQGVDVCEIYKKHSQLEQRYMELVEGGKR